MNAGNRPITPLDYEALEILVTEIQQAPGQYDKLIRAYNLVPSGDPKEKAFQILLIARH